jgi:hypothetical protein
MKAFDKLDSLQSCPDSLVSKSILVCFAIVVAFFTRFVLSLTFKETERM